MNRSESIKELAVALAKAQPEIKSAKKDSENPFFKSKYADLASVVDVIRGPLSKYGLSYVQLMQPSEKDQVCVETILLHTSGEWISGVLTLPVTKADAQGHGSAITYARRYGLSAIAGVTSEDDDGNASVKTNGKNAIAEPQRKASPTTTDKTTAKWTKQPGCITEAQKGRLFAIMQDNNKKTGFTEVDLKAHLLNVYGIKSTMYIKCGRDEKMYDDICLWAEAKESVVSEDADETPDWMGDV